jgi:hypothetical protein
MAVGFYVSDAGNASIVYYFTCDETGFYTLTDLIGSFCG